MQTTTKINRIRSKRGDSPLSPKALASGMLGFAAWGLAHVVSDFLFLGKSKKAISDRSVRRIVDDVDIRMGGTACSNLDDAEIDGTSPSLVVEGLLDEAPVLVADAPLGGADPSTPKSSVNSSQASTVLAEVIVPKFVEGNFLQRNKAAVYYAKTAKAKWGLLKRTEANRLMVTGWLCKELKAHGMRPTHIVACLPMACNLTFVPTTADIESEAFMAIPEVQKRIACMQPWNRETRSNGWKNLWGLLPWGVTTLKADPGWRK